MSRNPSRITFFLLPTLLFLAIAVSAAAQPKLSVDRTSLDFLAQGQPAAQTLVVSSTGAPLPYLATAGSWSSASEWLSVTPASGMTPATLSVRADATGLSDGVYFGYVEVTSGEEQRTRVDVALRVGRQAIDEAIGAEGQAERTLKIPLVIPAQPRVLTVTVSPPSVTLTGTPGGPKVSGTVTITSSPSGQTLNFVSHAAWLTVSQSSGVTPVTLTVTGDPTLIGQNTAAKATVEINGPVDTFFYVNLLLGAAANNTITASPTSTTFSQTLGGSTPASQTIQLTSSTPANYTVSVPLDATWLNVSPQSGSTGTSGATLTLVATATGLTAGSHSTSITINGPANSVSIPITFNVTGGTTTPAITASPTSVSFTQIAAGITPLAQSVQLSSATQVGYSVSVPAGANWLMVTPMSGNTPATLMFSVNTTGLSGGPFSTNVTVNGGAAPVTIPVTLTLAGTTPGGLTVSPTSIAFTQVVGGTALPQSVQLTSPTATTFTAGSSATWLSVLPTTGQLAANTAVPLTLTVSASGLPTGTSTGTITITTPGGATATVNVSLTITSTSGTSGSITVSPPNLAFFQTVGAASPTSQTVQVSSDAAAAFTVTIGSDAPWLTVNSASAASATTPATLTFSVNGTNLAVGNYSTSVAIAGPVNTVMLPVTLTVFSNTPGTITAAPPSFVFSQSVGDTSFLLQRLHLDTSPGPTTTATPSSIYFSQAMNGAVPAAQSIQLFSSPSVNFTTVVSPAAPWLTVTPSSTGTPATLTLSASSAGLAAGQYLTTLTVTGGAMPVTIPVTFNFAGNNTVALNPTSVTLTQASGGAAASQVIQLNGPQGTSFSASSNQPWLTVSPASGAIGTTATALTLSVNAFGLPVGTNQATVTVNAGGVMVTCLVTLTITPAATGTPTSFVASSNASWLNLSPTSGTTPTDLVLSVSGAGMPAGTYSSTITIAYGGSSLLTIPVSLTVTGGGTGGLSITPVSLSFSQSGATAPTSQTLQVSSAIPVSVTASPGASWLTVTPTTSTTPATFIVSANGTGQANGTAQTSLTLNAGGAPVNVPVTLAISGVTPPAISLSPPQVSFSQILGGPTPASQTVQVSSATVTSFTASVPPTVTWLNVSPNSGGVPGTLTLSVNPAGLSAGPYQTTVTIMGGGVTATLPVALTITGTAVSVSPAALTFSGSATGSSPASQMLSVSSTGNPFAFTATAATTTSANWLTVTPASGMTPGTLTVTASPVGLPAGQYSGSVTITPSDPTLPAQTVNVTLTVTASSMAFIRAILNAASEQPGPIAPGEILAITGTNLGPTVGSGPVVLPSGAVATSVAGVRVLFDGIAAPVLFVRSDQVNAVVPYGIFGRVSTSVQVEVAGVPSAPINLRVADTSPAIFTVDSSGGGQGAIVNQDATVNSPTFAAPRGSYISIYATGEGQTTPGGQDGRIISTDLRMPVNPVSVTIGGLPLKVLYAGSAPGSVSGLMQVNVQIPADMTPGGQLPVLLQVGNTVSPLGVTMAVK